jgi:uncharacterized protein YhfF
MPGLRRARGNRLIAAFWAEFRKTHPGPDEIPITTVFGDSPDQQNELCALILSGRKRATASLAQWYGPDGEKLPEPGDLTIILDGAGTPRGVIQITAVETLPFNQVTAAFAAEEGEGDGSLAYWQSEHRRFFAAAHGSFSEDMQIVCERFTLIWQPG